MITTEGLRIVGYRYGEAPKCGRSWNYREQEYECGVSMASVGYDKEIGSFAVSEARSRRKYYYIGTICGVGGDDEICLRDVKRITYRQYIKLRIKMVGISNQIVNDRIDSKIALIERGWSIGYTVEQLEHERIKYLHK